MSGSRHVNQGLVRRLFCSPFFNLRPPRGGVFFDGTSGANISSSLGAAAALYTDPRSVVLGMKVGSNPTSDTEFARIAETASPTSYYLRFVHGSNGTLKIRIFGSGTGEYRETTWAGLSEYIGQGILCAFVADASGRKLYVNGVEVPLGADTVTTSPPSNWQGAIGTGSAGGLRFSGTGLSYAITTATLYNLALVQTDVEEIYFLGGAVPYRFQWGSQVGQITGDNNTFTTGLGNWTDSAGTAVLTNTGGQMRIAMTAIPDTAVVARLPHNANLALAGKAYRVSFLHTLVSGTGSIRLGGYAVNFNPFSDVSQASIQITPSVVQTAFSVTGTIKPGSSADTFAIGHGVNSTETLTVDIDNYQVARAGAVLHLPFDEGIGYQLHDSSSNKLDALLTTAGCFHLIEKRTGYVRATLTYAATHEGKYMVAAQRMLPSGAVIRDIALKSSAASTGSGGKLGTSNDSARWAALQTYTTGKKILTLANRTPGGDANGDHDLLWDPDTNNITATQELEVQYEVMEGAAV